jgi:hypothetical protein
MREKRYPPEQIITLPREEKALSRAGGSQGLGGQGKHTRERTTYFSGARGWEVPSNVIYKLFFSCFCCRFFLALTKGI